MSKKTTICNEEVVGNGLVTSELLKLKELFLTGVLESVEFAQGKLFVFVSYDKSKGEYLYQVDYANCEAWDIEKTDTCELAWDNIINAINLIPKAFEEPQEVLEERIATMPWATKETHEKVLKELVGEYDYVLPAKLLKQMGRWYC